MWGTVARMRMKAGHQRALLALSEEEIQSHRPRGFIGSQIYRSTDDPQELWMAVAFESEEAYRANADSPEQDAWYQKMLEHLEGAPEWHDGEIVQSL